MKRRQFMVTAGAAVGGLAGFDAVAAPHVGLGAVETRAVEIAIKGGFGAGFRLCAAERLDGRIVALIAHHENYLEVASSDLSEWVVLRATRM